jgi:hypothetical protein
LRLFRKLILVLLWLLFVGLWYRVYRITTIGDVKDAVSYLTAITATYGVLVTVWVLHNIAIYKKKGPRRTAPLLAFSAIHDHLGSYIVAPANVRHKQAITVTVADGQKVFSETVTPR